MTKLNLCLQVTIGIVLANLCQPSTYITFETQTFSPVPGHFFLML